MMDLEGLRQSAEKNASTPHEMGYMQPYIVIGAFSLEILMKYLHILETGEVLRGHKLFDLYCQLSGETKKHMRAEVPKIASTGLHREISKAINGENIQFSWEPHKLISNSSLAFERWRYSFESKADVSSLGTMSLGEHLNRVSSL